MMQRIVDVVFAVTVLVLFLPFAIPIMIALRLTGEGKIFYYQPRVGYRGEIFRLIKFATMLEDSPNLLSGDITLRNDPRVLPLGKFLRSTKINEVPQILNILKGDMALVGPRPLTPRNFALYSKDVRKEIVRVRPGLTGIGSIVFRDEESILAASDKSYLDCYADEISPYKGALEQWYIRNRSLWLDLKIVLLTAWVVLFPRSDLYTRLIGGLPPRP
jgi:lipopolysaccharide/colanic/teichoic acid biosynthesis glycosyltransferase